MDKIDANCLLEFNHVNSTKRDNKACEHVTTKGTQTHTMGGGGTESRDSDYGVDRLIY